MFCIVILSEVVVVKSTNLTADIKKMFGTYVFV
jgi:hypothetical protein